MLQGIRNQIDDRNRILTVRCQLSIDIDGDGLLRVDLPFMQE